MVFLVLFGLVLDKLGKKIIIATGTGIASAVGKKIVVKLFPDPQPFPSSNDPGTSTSGSGNNTSATPSGGTTSTN